MLDKFFEGLMMFRSQQRVAKGGAKAKFTTDGSPPTLYPKDNAVLGLLLNCNTGESTQKIAALINALGKPSQIQAPADDGQLATSVRRYDAFSQGAQVLQFQAMMAAMQVTICMDRFIFFPL